MIFRSVARELRASDWSFGLPSDGSIPHPGESFLSDAGVPVTEGMSMRLSSVFSCAGIITNTLATMPKGAFHKERRGDRLVPVEDDPPQVLADPHPEMDPVDWWSRIIMSLLMRGNGYGLITATSDDAWPIEILPLHPDTCRPRRNRSTGAIEYQIPGYRDAQLAWPRGPVWPVRGMTLPGAIEGLSVLECARQGIGLALSAEEYGARFFHDSAIPSGALKVKERIADDERGRQRAREIIGNFRRTHGRRRIPALLTDGAEWQSISVTPNEAQFLETRKFQIHDVARMFLMGGSVHLIDPTAATAWGSGIEQLGLGFRIYTCGSWIVRLEQAFRRLLPGDQYARFNVNGLERGDFKTRHEGYAQARMWGLQTVNEIRALEELPPIDGGDVLLQPANYRDAATPTLKERADAAGVLIRSGLKAEDVLAQVGLPPMEWTGRLPVTIQKDDVDDPDDDAPDVDDLDETPLPAPPALQE